MYCKECGKEIAVNSKFCQFCGVKQDDSIVNKPIDRHKEKIITIPKIQTNFSPKTKKIISWYSIWFIINLIFLVVDT